MMMTSQRSGRNRDRHGESRGFLDDADSDTSVDAVVRRSQSKKPCCGGSKDKAIIRPLVLILTISCILWVLLLGYVAYYRDWVSSPSEKAVCESPGCHVAAGDMLRLMNLSASPCSDFYGYTCGRWLSAYPNPPDRGKWTQFSRIDVSLNEGIRSDLDTKSAQLNGQDSSAIEKAKQFYNSCMNLTTINGRGVKPALEFSKQVRGTPGKPSGITEALAFAHSYGFAAMLSISVDQDSKAKDQNVIQVSHPDLTLGDETQYSGATAEQYRAAWQQYAEGLASVSGANVTAYGAEMGRVYAFEQQLAQAFQAKAYMQKEVTAYHSFSLSEAHELYGETINLKKLLELLFKKKFEDSQKIIVYTPDYARNLSRIVAATDESTLYEYMEWRVLDVTVGYLSDGARVAALPLSRALYGTQGLPARWLSCVQKVVSNFQYATSALYLNGRFGPRERSMAEDVLERIRASFAQAVPSAPWMDAPTKAAALDKLERMEKLVGYPDWLFNATALDVFYHEAELVEGKFYESYLNVRRFSRARSLAKLDQKPQRLEWNENPAEVNAYYSPNRNYMMFPAGILRPPFFQADAPLSYNLGSLGAVMGHELTHGFDANGRSFDGNGELHDWWSAESERHYDAKTKCLVDQYSGYTVGGLKLDGRVTVTENMADNSGLVLAALAHTRALAAGPAPILPGLNASAWQLFFTAYSQIWCSYYTPQYMKTSFASDVHSYAEFRVLGAMSNSDEFAEAFGCPAAARYNPDHKCRVW